MNVRDLIQALQACDPELPVLTPDYNGGFHTPQKPVPGSFEIGEETTRVLLLAPPFTRLIPHDTAAAGVIADRIEALGTADACRHEAVRPSFNRTEARGLDPMEIERRWPPFAGVCTTCRAPVILYESREHYTAVQGRLGDETGRSAPSNG